MAAWLVQPGVEGLLDHMHSRVHHRVLDAAELGALALPGARFLRLEAQDVDLARDSVLLAGERRDPPAVVDVPGRELEPDCPVDGDRQLVERHAPG